MQDVTIPSEAQAELEQKHRDERIDVALAALLNISPHSRGGLEHLRWELMAERSDRVSTAS